MTIKLNQKFLLASVVCLFFLLAAVSTAPGVAANPSTTVLHTNISLSGTDLNAYTSTVNPNTPLITGNSIALSNLPAGLTFLQNDSNTYTTVNVGTGTIISDSSLFPNLAANNYNLQFLNNTYNAITYSSTDPGHKMTGTAPSISPTLLTASAYSNGTANSVYWLSQMGNKLQSSDTYTSPGAVLYIPEQNTNFFITINLYATGGAASDYVSDIVGIKTSSTDFLYTVTLHNTTGTSAITESTSGYTIDLYSAFSNYITMSIPVAQSWTDSATSSQLKGIDYNKILIHTASANAANQVSVKSHNVAIQSQLPALTTNSNLNGLWTYKDSSNLPANPWSSDDIWQTAISGPTSTTYNDNMPLMQTVRASAGIFNTLIPFQDIHFQGLMSLEPTTQSDVSSGSNSGGGFITNEITTYDIRSISPTTNSFYSVARFSSIFSVTSWKFNITLSPVILFPFSSTYGPDYIQNSYTQNSNPTPSGYNTLWSGVIYGATPVDKGFVITAFDLTNGEIDTFTIGFITQQSYNVQSTNTGNNNGGLLPPATSTGFTIFGMQFSTAQVIGLIAGAAVVIVVLFYFRGEHKYHK